MLLLGCINFEHLFAFFHLLLLFNPFLLHAPFPPGSSENLQVFLRFQGVSKRVNVSFHVLIQENARSVFQTYLYFVRKFSNFVLRSSSAPRNFPTSLLVDFPQLLDTLRNMWKFHINLQQD